MKKKLKIFITVIAILLLIYLFTYVYAFRKGFKLGTLQPLCKNETIMTNNTIFVEKNITCPENVCVFTEKNITNSLQYKLIVSMERLCEKRLEKCGDAENVYMIEDLEEELAICSAKLNNISDMLG